MKQAQLDELTYQRCRKQLADHLEVGVTGLDRIIRDYRKPSKMAASGNFVGRNAARTFISWGVRRLLNSLFKRRY